MGQFNVGDKVRYVGNHSGRRAEPSVVGKVGIVDSLYSPHAAEPQVSVVWEDGAAVYTLPYEYNLEAVSKYDQDTVNAIVKALRENERHTAANYIVERFSVPKARTVSVNFQVPEGESVVDYLENIGIDYDIEGGN